MFLDAQLEYRIVGRKQMVDDVIDAYVSRCVWMDGWMFL